MSETVPCKFCDGTGRVPAVICSQIVNGRPCRLAVNPDPAYYEMFPERAHLKGMCNMHRNVCVRDMLR